MKVPIDFKEGFLETITKEAEKLSVLKETTNDILMNHDQFLDFSEEAQTRRPKANSSMTAQQIVHFAETALLKILEVKQFRTNPFSVDG